MQCFVSSVVVLLRYLITDLVKQNKNIKEGAYMNKRLLDPI